MKHSKFLCILLCFFLLVTVLVACNEDKNATNDTDSLSPTTVSEATKEESVTKISPAETEQETIDQTETSPETDQPLQAETMATTETEAATVVENTWETLAETQAATTVMETVAETQAATEMETEAQTEAETEAQTEAETEAQTAPQDVPFSTEVASVYDNLADLNGLYVVRSEVNAKGMLLRELYLDLMSNMMHPLSTLSYVYDDEGNLTAMTYTDVFYHDKGTVYLNAEGKEIDGDGYVEFYENGLLKKRSITVDGEEWLCEYDSLGRRVHELYEDFDSIWVYEGDSFNPIRYELEDIGEGKSSFDLIYENGQLSAICVETEGQTGAYAVAYDTNGYIGSFGFTYQEQLIIMSQFTWNDKRQFTQTSGGGNTYSFEYDAEGNNTKITCARNSGDTSQVREVYTYAYENNLKISGRRDSYNDDGSLSSYHTYEWTYNDKGDMTSYTSSWVTEGNGNTSTHVTTEEYKPNGNKFRATNVNYVNGEAHQKYVREYENGLNVKTTTYSNEKGENNTEFFVSSEELYEYDAQRRKSSFTTIRYNEDGSVSGKTVRVYTYDADGNQSYTETVYDAAGNIIA